MRIEDVMRRCEDVKMYDRPPLLEEPFAQTLSGTKGLLFSKSPMYGYSARNAATDLKSLGLLMKN